MSQSKYAAQYFLQSVIDFIREKTIEHGSFKDYLETRAKERPHDAMEFLMRAVVPCHEYDIARSRHMENAGTSARSLQTIKILLIIAVVVVAIGVVAMIAVNVRFKEMDYYQIARFVFKFAMGVTIFVVMNIILFGNINDAIRDANAAASRTPEGDAFFDKFNNAGAIGVFYATTLTFPSSLATRNRSEILRVYNDLSKPSGQSIRKKVSFDDVVKGNKSIGDKSWRSIVDDCAPDYLTAMSDATSTDTLQLARSFSFGSSYQVQTLKELHELVQEEEAMSVRNIHYVFRQVNTKAKELFEMVGRKEDGNGDEALAAMDFAAIVKERIAPLFVLPNNVREIRDMAIKEVGALASLGAAVCSGPDQALMMFAAKKECTVAQYGAKSKRCNMFATALPRGCVLVADPGSRIFLSGPDDQTVFLEGAEPSAAAEGGKSDVVKAKTKDVRAECLNDAECAYAHTRLNAYWRTKKVDAASVRPCADTDGCVAYKMSTASLTKPIDAVAYTESVRQPVERQLLQLSESLYYTLQYQPHLEPVMEELAVHYDEDQIDAITIRISEIFEAVDEQVRKRGASLSTMRFMPKSAFYVRLDAYTVSDISFIQTDVVDKLYRLVSALQKRVQSGVVHSADVDDNPFVSEERQIRRLKNIFILIGTVLTGVLVAYITRDGKLNPYIGATNDAFEDGPRKAKIDTSDAIGAIVPCVMFAIVITLMYAYYNKRKAAFEFNRDVLETNTAKLINAMFVLSQAFRDVIPDERRDSIAPSSTVKTLNVPVATKEELYDDLVAALALFEKCNLITRNMGELPFPITDVAINLAVVVIVAAVMVTLLGNLYAADTVSHIHRLHAIVKEVHENPRRFTPEDFPEIACETNATASMRLTGIAMVVVFGSYLVQLLSEYPYAYRKGLYNSKYYVDGKCVK